MGKEEEKWGRGWGEGGEWNRKVVREWKEGMLGDEGEVQRGK